MKQGYTVFVGDVALDEYYEVQRFPAVKEKVHISSCEIVSKTQRSPTDTERSSYSSSTGEPKKTTP